MELYEFIRNKILVQIKPYIPLSFQQRKSIMSFPWGKYPDVNGSYKRWSLMFDGDLVPDERDVFLLKKYFGRGLIDIDPEDYI